MSITSQATAYQFPHPPPVVFQAAIAAAGVARFDMKATDHQQGRLSAVTGWSMFSFGERIEIAVSPAPLGSQVHISSRLRMPTNIMAGGRHALNFQRFFEALAPILANTAPRPSQTPPTLRVAASPLQQQSRHATCPRCHAVVDVAGQSRPVCPRCGFK